jgi:hypothetical protein
MESRRRRSGAKCAIRGATIDRRQEVRSTLPAVATDPVARRKYWLDKHD